MALPEDDSWLLLHNPRCSKSRATQALLEERGVEFSVRLYLEDPLDRADLEALRQRLGRPVSEWVRKGETAYAEAGLSADAEDDAILEAMVAHPILLERPVLVGRKAARVGRPPERVLELV